MTKANNTGTIDKKNTQKQTKI